jgi:hypothetical protein
MESGLTLAFHGVQLTVSIAVLGIVLNQHKVWVRMKDRINSLWYKHCKETGDRYTPLDNGK